MERTSDCSQPGAIPAEDAPEPMVRFGQVGVLALDEDADRLQCHLCGKWYRNLASHALKGHRLPPVDYRELAGLNRQTHLYSPGLRAAFRAQTLPGILERRAAGKLPNWGEDPERHARDRAAAVAALQAGVRPETRLRRSAAYTDERRARLAAQTAARNRAGELRATGAAIAAGQRRALAPRACARCGRDYQPAAAHQRYCPDCGKVVARERGRAWAARRLRERRGAAPGGR